MLLQDCCYSTLIRIVAVRFIRKEWPWCARASEQLEFPRPQHRFFPPAGGEASGKWRPGVVLTVFTDRHNSSAISAVDRLVARKRRIACSRSVSGYGKISGGSAVRRAGPRQRGALAAIAATEPRKAGWRASSGANTPCTAKNGRTMSSCASSRALDNHLKGTAPARPSVVRSGRRRARPPGGNNGSPECLARSARCARCAAPAARSRRARKARARGNATRTANWSLSR